MVLAGLSVRALGRAMIPNLLKKGVSARGYRRLLIRQFGSSYRWQTVLADFREFNGMLRFEAPVRNLGAEKKPNSNIMTEVTYRRRRRYRGIGRATYRNVDTGEEYQQVISMYDNKFESKQAFTDKYIQDTEKAKYKPEWEIANIDWYVIQHREGWSY